MAVLWITAISWGPLTIPLTLFLFLVERPGSTSDKCKPPRSWRGRTLYKYGRLEKPEHLDWLKDIILNHRIYIPKPGELNDPREAKPKIAESTMEAHIRTLFAYFVKANPGMSPHEQRKNLAIIRYNLPRFGIDWIVQAFETALAEEFVNQRIYSLSKRPDNLHL